MKNLNIPVGVSDFTEIRKNGYYYIDKSGLIKDILKTASTKVTLITRPRRFGKTLAMSMLDAYFDIRKDSKQLFDGLEISQNQVLCSEWMNKYPTIFVSFRQVEGLDFKGAYDMLTVVIANLFNEHIYLLDSKKATEFQKTSFKNLLSGNASVKEVKSSIYLLMNMMNDYYNEPVILLIDEYDVPVAKANNNGYYNEMLDVMKSLMQTVKDNKTLKFAIITGCLRIAKESIFTGLNNFEVVSIMDSMYDECFGFTDKEVQEILKYFNLSEHYADIREWYDGYHFGNTDIYCPWDVIRYCKSLCADPTAKPQDFWSNSSGNALVRSFIDKADVQTKDEIERLIAGEYIEKEISQELTYDEIDKSIANLWSVLFTTGYLTKQGVTDDGRVRLSIPNREIKNLFIKKIREWFSDTTANDGKTLEQFCNAFVDKDTEKIEELFGDYLWNTISIRDTAVAKDKKENFYHGILLGLLGYKASWLIKSNTESGTGYSDILVEVPNNRTGIVIELKYAENGDMDAACDEALNQIEKKSYVDKLKQDGMRNFIKYGIACFKKDCKVVVSK